MFVQDLDLRLPLMAVAAAWLWRHQPHGYLIVGAGLVMWVIESACVAVGQWYGHAANPASTVTSIALVPAFAALAWSESFLSNACCATSVPDGRQG